MNGRKNLNMVLAVCVFLAALAGPAGGRTIYVDPNGSADFNSIQAAIDDANDEDEIEVAPGTYCESINFNGKAARLYSSWGPDSTTIDANGAYHVVQCLSGEDANTILEGFTITGGDANGTYPNNRGAGMYNYSSSPTVKNCIFEDNTATVGGGMDNYNSSPTVTNCTFSGNSADWSGGGGMNNLSSSPTVTDCNFSGNSAVDGGGMHNYSSSPTVRNCTFSGNSADDSGGGMYSKISSPTVTNCNFRGNTAGYGGGGMYNYSSSSPTVTDCNFSGNSASSLGGGMYNYSSSSPTVTDCIFTGNGAGYGGGGMGNENNSNPVVTNCTFSGNTADYGGGGIGNENNSNPIVTNCTFSGNTGASGGGGIGNVSSSPKVTNCVLWGNTPDEIYDDVNSSATVSYSDIQGGGYTDANNIDADPLFVDAAGGDLRLSSDASPCVDTGDNNTPGLPATDFAGNPRIVDGDGDDTAVVDMGAYEFQTWLIHNINKDRWYETIQAAIDDANDEDEIEVAPGTYYESINFIGKAVRLYSRDGADVTTIDGTGNYHVVQCVSGEDANTVLEGFTITGGNANGTMPNDRGGGMYNNGSSPTVNECIFTSNTADYGGGMHNYDGSSPMVTDCTFTGNSANYGGGGGMSNLVSSPTVTGCTFRGNTAATEGGGMLNGDSSPTVTNCTFGGNSADWGGGMRNRDSGSPTVTNCTFSGNSADWGGGMSNRCFGSPTVTNCTFTNNSASSGGGMYNEPSGSLMVTNCVFWGDTPYEIEDMDGFVTVTYSDVGGGTGQSWFGTGCIDADPCFVSADSNDFRPGPGSPCIDAGNNTAVPSSVLKDLAGKLRFADDPCTSDTGDSGTNGRPVVDMGAYEYQCCGTISQNLLANPGFETGDATGWMANWGLKADSNQVHDGNYSGLASGRAAAWDGAYQSVMGLMDDGKTYTISGWVRLQNADSNYVQLTVKKTDSDGTHFCFIDSATGFDNQWVHLDGTLALDVNGQPTELFVYFEGPVPDVNFYVDDASVTEVMGDMDHNGGVDLVDFSLLASYYGFDCSTQDCGRANLYDCDKAITERDLAILVREWLVGVE